jgi:hypothetical protein
VARSLSSVERCHILVERSFARGNRCPMTSPNLRPSYGLPGSALIGVNAQEIVLIGILTLNWSREDQ